MGAHARQAAGVAMVRIPEGGPGSNNKQDETGSGCVVTRASVYSKSLILAFLRFARSSAV
jgi:hypothetical protein